MADKHVVVQGAMCKCQFGTVPDKLKVLSHTKEYANDSDGTKKLIASTKEIGAATFEKNCFGSCAKMNNNTCKAVVQEWTKYYEKTILNNKGKILTEESKAICPVAGSPCIEILWHGQTGSVSNGSVSKTDKRLHAQQNPLVDTEEIQEEMNGANYYN